MPAMALTPTTMLPKDHPPTQKSAVTRLATLLGAFRLKNMPQKHRKKDDGCLSTLFSSDSAENRSGTDSSCCVPSLLLNYLTHGEGQHHQGHHDGSSKDKLRVEKHASSNLARMLLARPGTKSTESVTDDGSAEKILISELPLQMLDNLASSFLTLVDARLRAYITILARHGVSLSECHGLSRDEQQEGVLAVERKLKNLIKVGAGVSIDNMVTFFRLNTDDSQDQQQEGSNELTMPLVMETTMDVSIPKIGSGCQLLTIGASVKGSINVSFNTTGDMLAHVEIQVDTHKLLAKLIDRASLVMSSALEIVTAVCALPPRFPRAPLPKHDSEAAKMPPPKPVAVQVSNQLAVVSPEITCKQKEFDVSSFQLDDTVENLSPESCANIVDFVISEVIFPPLKRFKTTSS